MGCGKSTIGRQLQKMLGFPMVDTDRLIEKRAGCPIKRIFARDGEEVFRDHETAVLRELAGTQAAAGRIIATGGGIVLREENRMLLRQLGCVVWLRVPAAEIAARTARSNARPLLDAPDPQARIDEMLAARTPLYHATAHVEIDTDDLTPDESACGVLESVRFFLSHPT